MHRTEGYSVCRLRCVSLGALCISSFLLMSHMSYLQICLSIWTQTVKFAWWDSIRENDTLHCCWGLFYALGTRQSCHLSFLALRNWVALLKQHVDDRQPTNRHCPNEAVLFSIPYFPPPRSLLMLLSTIFVSRTVLLRISPYGSQSISMTTITRSDDTLIVSNIVTKVVTVIIIDLWCKMNNIHVIIASTLTVK